MAVGDPRTETWMGEPCSSIEPAEDLLTTSAPSPSSEKRKGSSGSPYPWSTRHCRAGELAGAACASRPVRVFAPPRTRWKSETSPRPSTSSAGPPIAGGGHHRCLPGTRARKGTTSRSFFSWVRSSEPLWASPAGCRGPRPSRGLPATVQAQQHAGVQPAQRRPTPRLKQPVLFFFLAQVFFFSW